MAHAFSYSGPSPAIRQLRGCVVTAYLCAAGPGSLLTRPQAIVQAKQALLAAKRVCASASPLMFSASSNTVSRRFRVGNAPCSLMTLTSTSVP